MAQTFTRHPSNEYQGPRCKQGAYFSERRMKWLFTKVERRVKLTGVTERRIYRDYLYAEEMYSY